MKQRNIEGKLTIPCAGGWLGRKLAIADDSAVGVGGGDLPKLHAVRAKMSCQAVESTRYSPTYLQHKVNFGVVCGDDGEDKSYSDATPSGACWLQISDGRPALDFFKPGKKYYVTFTEAVD